MKHRFIQGALILTIAGIVVKIIGSVNRIILSRMLGGEGIGLYQMAYPIYQLALSVSSAGIPVAISILTAEKLALKDYIGANRIFRLSLKLMMVTGLFFTWLLYYGAGWLVDAQIVRDERAYYAIAALAPAIFFVTILSSYRGYFQGMQMMTPTAISQIVEQAIRVVVMIALAIVLLPYGLAYASAGASFGAAPGAAAGVIVLLYYYWRHRIIHKEQLKMQNREIVQESSYSIIKRMVILALPVSLANIMLPLTASIDLFIVPARLENAGYSVEVATELFGYLTGMAVSLVNLPTILTASLAASLVPAISEAVALKDRYGITLRAVTALRMAILLMIPSFAGLYLLAMPISEMLYATPNASSCIAVLSFGVVLLGIGQVTTGILQGLGHTTIPLINMIIAAFVKVILSWTLTANSSWGIEGAAWATNADFGTAALLNLFFIYRYVGKALELKSIFKVMVATVMMSIAVFVSYDALMREFWGNTISTMGAIISGGVIYTIFILLIGGVTKNEIESIPKVGKSVSRVLEKMRLI